MHWADRKRLGGLPPPESVLANWPEPGEHDVHGLQRYREACGPVSHTVITPLYVAHH